MIRNLLIANRGEIARRVIRTARRMGIGTVAVYSDADANAPHVREADIAIRLGPAPARESYLDQDKVLAAARESGADSLHPGYGFLSENASFAQAVIDAGLTWVGPPPSAISAMGLKDAAKRLMERAGVPITPGYLGEIQSPQRMAAEAKRIGYPVLIKAVAGGGGKGMRRVDSVSDFASALASAKREAAASFGDERVLIEKYVTRPRHIEVQVFADTHGHVVHLYERDCSVQRRHQKVIEEAPAPGMDDATREMVTSAAIRAAEAVDYVGAGTVEFIADASEGLSADRIWFMEMNTRLQVEHPVTELVTGLDLVEWQLRVAAGEPLPLSQDQIRLNGHALEARLYAENPSTGFLPSTGKLDHFSLPTPCEGLRIDSGVEQGGEVTPFYDPMIAKLITWASGRQRAAARLAEAGGAVEVWPEKTNAGFLARCLDDPDFVAGQVDTGFIEARLSELAPMETKPSPEILRLAAAAALQQAPYGDEMDSPWTALDGLTGWRLNAPPRGTISLAYAGAVIDAPVQGVSLDFDPDRVFLADEATVIFANGEALAFSSPSVTEGEGEAAAASGQLTAPMPGRIVAVSAEAGDTVKKGQPVVTLEAMKMEHALLAPFDAWIAEISVKLGDQVSEGAVLARLEKPE